MSLPNLVKVEWENGDVTIERPIMETDGGEIYQLDVRLHGNYWVYKSMCSEIETDSQKYQQTKKELLELFRDFFIFHNEANKITCAVDDYFNEWYDARYPLKEYKHKPEKWVRCTDCRHCNIIQPWMEEPYGSVYCEKKCWTGGITLDGAIEELIVCEYFEPKDKNGSHI
jgi:hypothetical protein